MRALTFIMALIPAYFFVAGCAGRQTTEANVISADSLQVIDTPAVQLPDTVVKTTSVADPSWHEALQNERAAVTQPAKIAVPRGEVILSGKNASNSEPKTITKFNDPIRSKELLDGLEKAKSGDMKGALSDFSAAVIKNPKNYMAFFFLGKAKLEMNDREGALKDIEQSVTLFPNQVSANYYAGKIYFDKKEYSKALEAFTNALKARPDDAPSLDFRGVTKAMLGKHNEALTDYDAALKADPNYSTTYYNKGTSLAAIQKYDEAVTCFSEALKREANPKLCYINRGNCYVMLKNQQAAIEDYTKLVELDPKNSDAYLNRGTAYSLTGDHRMCEDWRKAASMGNAKAVASLKEYCGK
jgi:tetratricopeptide (TPR) repeat protein